MKKKKSKNEKHLDAVGLMRAIRDKLSLRYKKNPAAEGQDLMKIRQQYQLTNTVPDPKKYKVSNEPLSALNDGEPGAADPA